MEPIHVFGLVVLAALLGLLIAKVMLLRISKEASERATEYFKAHEEEQRRQAGPHVDQVILPCGHILVHECPGKGQAGGSVSIIDRNKKE